MFDLLVVGDLNADLILLGEDPVPAFGQAEKLVESGTLTIGGSSAITACGAARLGLRTGFVGVVGEDPLGRFLLEALAQQGVDVSACVADPSLATGISVILARPGQGGDRAILTVPGSIGAVSAGHMPGELLRRTRHLHCGAFFLQRSLQRSLAGLFTQAHAAGVTCSIDPNWDPSGRWDGGLQEALDTCDLFFPNREEALRVAGRDRLEDALAALADGREGLTVVAKLGEQGAVSRYRGETVSVAAPAAEAVDATGAGDTFDAGYLYGYLAGWDAARCLSLAVACGTLSTRRAGGTASQPKLEEALALATPLQGAGA